MIQYRIAEERDMESIIDFANMVFSMLRVPHNFEVMLPKVYSKAHLKADIHVIAEEEGRLCGCLGMLVYPLRVAGETLRVGYLGTMSVHPRVRGRGTMGTLMEKQIERGWEMGLDMMVLGGQRQRYGRHGFETCGTAMGYSISAANVRHDMAQVDAQGIGFAPMQQQDAAYAHALYERGLVAGARTQEEFIAALSSYKCRPLIITRGGKPIGYMTTSEDGQRISELAVEQEHMILPVIKAYLLDRGLRYLRVEAAPHDLPLNEALAPLCEGYTMGPNCMVRMLRAERVILAYMKLRKEMGPIGDGSLVLGCGEAGTVKITVAGGEISVVRTEEQADIALDDRQAALLLFACNRYGVPHAGDVPRGWFPLPLYVAEPDSF